MTIAARIKAAVAGFSYPCVQNKYTGTDATYFVFNLIVTPNLYADDEPEINKYSVMLHLFCPHSLNTTQLQKDIKLAVRSAGFSYPSQTDASDSEKQHIVFEFEDVEAI